MGNNNFKYLNTSIAMKYNLKFKLNIGYDKNYTVIPTNTPQIIDAQRLRCIHTPILLDNGLNDWKIDCDTQLRNETLGLCDYNEKTIYINPMTFYVMTFQQVRNIILHEVAHALCPDQGHNEVWKAKCIELGGTGNIRQPIGKITCVDTENNYYKIEFK